MTAPCWPRDPLTRGSRIVLRVAALLVPPWARSDWHSEWEGELWQLRDRRTGWGTLALFLAGALWHGVWEWREGWAGGSLWQDARYGLRRLARSPGFTTAAVLMLALSIGASTAFFSVIQEAVLEEPPYPEPERLVVVDALFAMPDEAPEPSRWSYPRFQALRKEIGSVEDLAGYQLQTMTLSDPADPEVIPVEVVSPSIFALLGVSPVQGRVFGPEEEDAGSATMVALVGHSLWLRRLGGASDVVGSVVWLDGSRVQVVGVLPAGFEGATGRAELWLPFPALREILDPSRLEDPWNQYFHVMGRLSAGATLESARSEVQAFGATIMDRFPPPPAASRLRSSADVVPLQEARRNPGALTSMMALMGAVLLFLLIATANLAGLLLARGANRRQEAAIRVSLGAGRPRLFRQLLTESLILAGLGGMLGIALAWLGVDTLGTWMGEALGTAGGRGLEYFDPDGVSMNLKVLAFSSLLTGGVGIVCGVLPGWQIARSDPAQWLRTNGAFGWTRKGLGGREALLGGQVAVALVLLAGASVLIRSLINLQNVPMGYDPEGLLTALYTVPSSQEEAGIDPGLVHLEFLERVRALPGVTGASLGEVPMGGPTWRTIVMGSEGRPELRPEEHFWIRLQPVADGHLRFLGAELLAGRDIRSSDDENAEKVVVLSRTAAEALFPRGDPVGRRVQLGWAGYAETGATVVGVVEDLQLDPPGQPAERQAFLSIRQAPRLETGVLARTTGDPSALIPAVRAVLAEVAPNVPLTSAMSLEARSADATARPRVVAALVTLFGVFSLLLVAVGLYGSVAYSVAQRTRELGLRASLGAHRFTLVGLVFSQALPGILLGITLGICASVWATRFIQSLLFEIQAMDTVALVGASSALLAVASLAAYVPARRAMRIDPMVALRAD